MDDKQLDSLLDEAPTTARLPWDPWPAIASATESRSTRRRSRLIAAGAALLFFGAGTATGMVLGGGGERPMGTGQPAEAASSALLAAARVQAAGSEYVAAVGTLHRMRAGDEGEAIASYAQGYEAALVVVEAVVETIRQTPVAESRVEELAGMARLVRRAHSAAVAELLEPGSSE